MNSPSSSPPPYFLTLLICFLLWLLMTASLAVDELFTGLLLAALVSWISASKLSILDGLRLYPGMFLALAKYLVYFFKALVIANFDLAARILSKQIDIQPELVEIETTMQSDLGKLFLANSITLTPGTLSVDVIDERILVHWIDSSKATIHGHADTRAATHAIVEQFEDYLKGFVK
ncbi:MAG: Na+/H+ antiporter subunit E [Pseudomonadota bacterium]